MEKPKLDNARKLRGIFFFDPDYEEYEEITEERKKNWKLQKRRPCLVRLGSESAQGCHGKLSIGSADINSKTKYACVVEAHVATKRLESTVPRNHVDHIVDKEFNPINHFMLVQKFIHYLEVLFTSYRSMTLDKEMRSFWQCF